MWTDAQVKIYRGVLKCYSYLALRLLAATNDVPLPDPSTRGRTSVEEVLVDSRAPLYGPAFLLRYKVEVDKVAAGEIAGGRAFGSPAPPRSVDEDQGAGAPSDDAQAQLAALRAKLKAAEDKLKRNDPSPQPPSGGGYKSLTMEEKKELFVLAYQAKGAVDGTAGDGDAGVAGAAPKAALSGYAKIVDAAKRSLQERTFPNPITLCRANREALRQSVRKRATKSARAVGVGADGSSLVIKDDDGAEGTITTASKTDSEFWSGLNGFFHVMAIMCAMPSDEMPRQALTDFSGVWLRLWDSTKGSHAAKIAAMETFWDANAETLGDGTWAEKLKTDVPFWQENMQGPNLLPCPSCNGTGEKPGSSAADSSISSSSGDAATSGGRGGSGRNRNERNRKRSRSPTRSASKLCESMLFKSAECKYSSCRFKHGPCPSCNGRCKSAAECKHWDRSAVERRFGDQMRSINDARKRANKRPHR